MYKKGFISILNVLTTLSLFILWGISCSDNKQISAGSNDAKIKQIDSSKELLKVLETNPEKMMIIDLYADWCMPCKQLSPILNSLSGEHKNDAVFIKVNIDKSPDIAAMFGVQSIPHVVFMKNKEAIYSLTGLHPKDMYKNVITKCGSAQSAETCIKQMQM